MGMLGGGVFPLEFGGEAVAGPAGEGVGFEEAEVADGGLGEVVEGAEAVEGVDAPAGWWWRRRAASRAGLASASARWVFQPSESQSSGRV